MQHYIFNHFVFIHGADRDLFSRPRFNMKRVDNPIPFRDKLLRLDVNSSPICLNTFKLKNKSSKVCNSDWDV